MKRGMVYILIFFCILPYISNAQLKGNYCHDGFALTCIKFKENQVFDYTQSYYVHQHPYGYRRVNIGSGIYTFNKKQLKLTFTNETIELPSYTDVMVSKSDTKKDSIEIEIYTYTKNDSINLPNTRVSFTDENFNTTEGHTSNQGYCKISIPASIGKGRVVVSGTGLISSVTYIDLNSNSKISLGMVHDKNEAFKFVEPGKELKFKIDIISADEFFIKKIGTFKRIEK